MAWWRFARSAVGALSPGASVEVCGGFAALLRFVHSRRLVYRGHGAHVLTVLSRDRSLVCELWACHVGEKIALLLSPFGLALRTEFELEGVSAPASRAEESVVAASQHKCGLVVCRHAEAWSSVNACSGFSRTAEMLGKSVLCFTVTSSVRACTRGSCLCECDGQLLAGASACTATALTLRLRAAIVGAVSARSLGECVETD